MTDSKETEGGPLSAARGLFCIRCKSSFPLEAAFEGCAECAARSLASNLVVTYDYDKAQKTFVPELIAKRSRASGVWRWAELLPIHSESSRVTLAEGSTPLLPWTGEGAGSVLLKDESRNPTWSYKDRFCAVAVSHAKSLGSLTCGAASSGNHGAAAAAYAGRAHIACAIFARQNTPQSMKSLVHGLGATLYLTPNEGHDRWELLRAAVAEAGWYPLSNYTNPPTGNPFGQEGYKTIAFELWEQLAGQVPGCVVVPTGYGEGLSGIWSGFRDLLELGLINRLPQMVAAETTAGPLFHALKDGSDDVREVQTSPSVAFSINTPTSSLRALQAIRESRGFSICVADDEILTAQAELGRGGFLVEASAASAVAAVSKARRLGQLLPEPVVALLTSSGMKDLRPQAAWYADATFIDGGWEQLRPMLNDLGTLGEAVR